MLTDRQKSFILDLCIVSHSVPNSRSDEYFSHSDSIVGRGFEATHAGKMVLKELVSRNMNFKPITDAINKLAEANIAVGESVNSDTPSEYFGNAADIISALAAFCDEAGLYWNDSAYSEDEVKRLCREYKFAGALARHKCFASMLSDKAKGDSVPSDGDAVISKVKTARAARGEGKKSAYELDGPQSGNVVGLVGTPGSKAHVSGNIYCIIADNYGTMIPNAFISPVDNKKFGVKPVTGADGLPTVQFGAGTGRSDLTIYFTYYSDATDTLRLIKEKGIADKFTNLRVVETKKNSHGYYKVQLSSDFGGEVVLVKAKKLNEAMCEELVELAEPEDTELAECRETPRVVDDFAEVYEGDAGKIDLSLEEYFNSPSYND